jgi:phosphatidylserine/phosphatidylglycerophosphate/cardiolipin synthase-like enzyme
LYPKTNGKKLFPDPGFLFGTALLKIFWSDPGISRETAVDKGIDREWVEFINRAQSTLDLACYNLGRQVIIDAIINARNRGVKVRMVGDVDESVTPGYQTIFRTDIPFSVGNASGIQHNKFAIADGKYVIMGTGNLTDTDLMMNNNNFAIIESPTLARAYTREFEQMFYGKFASKKSPRTLNRNHRVNFTDMELYFSPYDGEDGMAKMIELVNSAKKEINYMIFAHTHDELTTAFIRAAKRGVLVRGIHDYTFVKGTSMEASRLYNAGRLNPLSTGPYNKEDGNENTKIPGRRTSGGKLHCKTLIIDSSIVATGSFNWSNNAINNNDENMLIIYSPFVANELSAQWNSVWGYVDQLQIKFFFQQGKHQNMEM